ncbi:DUF2278 family protein [Dendronalium sp. ChiSLP03b]|uniref:DUF2278 family protein n=1 Tax=Dendronalium sp. ChiSLP03b TaxID=3075381 RepID=UPI002AD509BD|nr:DUF2278 family protein [Dendronalium sp. ChiSLP03b]MDZ8208358.1 DUF2278 family protein [Dendronalium sp. ChiSLP03b]
MSGIPNYSVLKGHIVKVDEDRDSDPHYRIFISDGTKTYKAAINVGSTSKVLAEKLPGIPPSYLLVKLDLNYQNPILAELVKLSFGFTSIEKKPNTVALDYIRKNLFDPAEMEIIPTTKDGANNDIFDSLSGIVEKNINNKNVEVYVFGSKFTQGEIGIHDVHMNQGSLDKKFKKDDGVYQDGGLFFHFKQQNKWIAMFSAFQSQCWHTDDISGHANTRNNCARPTTPGKKPVIEVEDDIAASTDVLDRGVLIREALVNPVGSERGNEWITLFNNTDRAIDLSGWTIQDGLKRAEPLQGSIPSHAHLKVTLLGTGAILSNTGGIISLINQNGLKVHGVAYT